MDITLSGAALSPLAMLRNAGGSLDTYIRTVNQIPVLSPSEERALAVNLRAKGDLESATRLIAAHLRLVVSVARGYIGYGLPQGDLIQEGTIGLMKAVKRFDPERGTRLSTYAMHWIKAEMHEFIVRNWRLVKIASTKAQRKLFFNLRSLMPGFKPLSRAETADIARNLHVKPRDVSEMESRLAGGELAFDAENGAEDDWATSSYLQNPLPEPSLMIEIEEAGRSREGGLAGALAALDSRSRRIIEARWLCKDKKSTLHDLAAELNVSAERIRQIEVKALQRMKGRMIATASCNA